MPLSPKEPVSKTAVCTSGVQAYCPPMQKHLSQTGHAIDSAPGVHRRQRPQGVKSTPSRLQLYSTPHAQPCLPVPKWLPELPETTSHGDTAASNAAQQESGVPTAYR